MPSEHWCHPDLNLDVEVPMIEFSELSNAFYAIAARSEVKDIRAWFGQRHNKLFKRDSQRVAFSLCVGFSV